MSTLRIVAVLVTLLWFVALLPLLVNLPSDLAVWGGILGTGAITYYVFYTFKHH